MNFIIDTKGESELQNKDQLIENDDDDDIDIENSGFDLNISNITNLKETVTKKQKKKLDPNDIDLEEFERDMGWNNKRRKPNLDKDVKAMKKAVAPIEKILKKSVIKPGFERLKRVPGYDTSEKKLKITRKGQRNATKGKDWFNLPATEITDEIRHDLEVLQMRSALDPKHFYKKNDMKVLPKYFHIGKVMDNPINYYCGRLTKKERKRTIVDELMADAQFSKYNKRKYKEIIDEKSKLQYKAYKHAKKLKKKANKK